MKNIRFIYFVILATIISSCCKNKNDKYNEMSASDKEWFMTGSKQFAIYRDSATQVLDTLVYGEISTQPIDCEKINVGSWLVNCKITSCEQYVLQKLSSINKDSFNRVSEIVYANNRVFYETDINDIAMDYRLTLSTASINGRDRNGYFLDFPKSLQPEPFMIFANKAEGVLCYKYRDNDNRITKWEKIN